MNNHSIPVLVPLVVGMSIGVSVNSASALASEPSPAQGAIAAIEFSTNFADTVVLPNSTLWISFPASLNIGEGQFAVLIGTEDVTAQFRWASPTRLEGAFSTAPLQPGQQPLTVYRREARNIWSPLIQTSLSVQAAVPASVQASVQAAAPRDGRLFKPALIVGAKSQRSQSHSTDAASPDRSTHSDVTLQVGLQSRNGGDGWSVASQFNVAGSSYLAETPQYEERAGEAPKVDLATYLVQAEIKDGERRASLSVGQVQSESHPLLTSGFAQRGLLLNQSFGERYNFAASVQSGNQAFGGHSLLGLGDSGQRLSTFTGNVELLDRLGALSLGGTVFDGAMRPAPAPGVASLQEEERSHGWGLQLRSQSEGHRLRGELAFAHSQYISLPDGTASTASAPSVAGNSWKLRAEADLLRGEGDHAEKSPTLGAHAQHELVAADYKSIGAAAVAANHVQNTLGLNGSLRGVTSTLSWSRRSDNVNNEPSVPRLLADTVTFSLAVPFGQLIDRSPPPAWAPTASYEYVRLHSFADRGHVPLGQSLADLPDAVVTQHGLTLAWAFGGLNIAYRHQNVLQDNLQPGFESNDVASTGRGLTAAYALGESFSISGSVESQRSLQRFSGVLVRNENAQINCNWNYASQFSLAATIGIAQGRDDTHAADSRNAQFQIQLIKPFKLTGLGPTLPGQWSLLFSENRGVAQNLRVRYDTLNVSLAIAFF